MGGRDLITGKIKNKQLHNDPHVDWITALHTVQIDSLIHKRIIQPDLFDKQEIAEIQSDYYPGECLIV